MLADRPRAAAVALAARGMNVLAIGRRLAPLEQTQKAAADVSRVHVLSADVSTEAGRSAVAESLQANKATGHVQCLVHNAAVVGPLKPMEEVTLQEFQSTLAINLEGPLFLTQKVLPFMAQPTASNNDDEEKAPSTGHTTRLPRILHISSGAAHSAYATLGTYCISKSGLHMLYKLLGQELSGRVVVGSMRPGVVDTPMQGTLRNADGSKFSKKDYFVSLHAEKKLISPKSVADFIMYLLWDVDDTKFAEDEWDIRTAQWPGATTTTTKTTTDKQ